MKRVIQHIIFWMAMWLFRGYFQYTMNQSAYLHLPFKQQFFLNFFPELIITIIKIVLCYTIAHFISKQIDLFKPSIMVQVAGVFLLGVILRQLTLAIWVNTQSHQLSFINVEVLLQVARIMNSVIDLGFVLGLFMVFKNYRQKLKWIRREQELIKEKLESELNFLKAQTNPHFLFNTLNNFFSMAQASGNYRLADSILMLSDLMRYSLYESGVKLIPISKELEYVSNFIKLTKLRYKDEEVTVVFDHSAVDMAYQIPPMIIMPFVENAFKHGVAIGHQSIVSIIIKTNEGVLSFSCENSNYQRIRQKDSTAHGVGLSNVKRRLQLLYPTSHSLTIQENDQIFKVHLTITL